ncbi:BRO-G [Alphabaculovirus altermyunipunctae]|uniref:BRO-G n=1 Tax=Mythimna unipuncta nucleopolyhedrovirus TaxID=447897 RepID=A0A346TPQ4_9ABAC|nr:BRO-G [Mythimna unipuncta nucleopolyhedrovirus]AXU41564.1 BRO-G [Mythimna unipuncta nucleopolyhedrovirus]
MLSVLTVIVAKHSIDRRQSYKRARTALIISVHLNVDRDCLLRHVLQTVLDMETRSGRVACNTVSSTSCHDRNKYKKILIHRFIYEQVCSGGDDRPKEVMKRDALLDRRQQQQQNLRLLQMPLIRDVYKNMCYLRERNIQQLRTINMLKLALVNERKKYQSLLTDRKNQPFTDYDRSSPTPSLPSSSSNVMDFVKLSVFRNDRTFYVVTGQHAYVKAKSKQFSCNTRRIVDTVTVSPKIDCQAILREAKKTYGALVEISKRRLYFKYERNADEFQTKLKYMYDIYKKSIDSVV